MLADLLPVRSGALAAGFDLTPLHGDIKTLAKARHLLVHLTDTGTIRLIEEMPEDTRRIAWSVGDGNHNHVPRINAKYLHPDPKPLVEAKASPDAVLDEISDKVLAINPKARIAAGYLARLRERRQQLAVVPEFVQLVDAILAACEQNLWSALLAWVQDHRSELSDQVCGLMADLILKGGPVYLVHNLTILSDDCRRRISQALIAGRVGARGICALTGRTTTLLDAHVPKRTVPIVGGVTPYSRFKDLPTLTRYGLLGAGSLPMGQSTVDELDASLREITAEPRRNVTWRGVAGDLLIAYVPGDLEIGTVAFFDVDRGAVFEEHTKAALDAIKVKVGNRYGELPIEFMLIHKINDGTHTVPVARHFTIDRLETAAAAWQAGARNLPPIQYLLPPLENAAKPRLSGAICPTPLQVPALLATKYVRGLQPVDAPAAFKPADAVALYADDRHASQALALILSRHGPMLRTIAGHDHAHRLKTADPRSQGREAALRSLALLGIVLAKHGRHVEDYMHSPGYQLGQILAAADILHRCYCEAVRDGSMPPELLGGAHLDTAQAHPVRALAMLVQRWRPYSAWAKTVQAKAGDDSPKAWAIRRANATLRRIAPLAETIAGQLPKRPDDEFKAELLLGYIAGLPKAEASRAADKETTDA